jgi:transposase InsO family protein
MPWRLVTVEQQRREFVKLASQQAVPFRELCRRFGISARVGYKWQQRFREGGEAGLRDRSRRPHRTRPELPADRQQAIVAIRQEHPCWGARKIRWVLQGQGEEEVPATSTITTVLHRQGLIGPEAPPGQRPTQRFERPVPNDLWQMDFKAPVRTLAGQVHILSVLDDHSRFVLGVQALGAIAGALVQASLTRLFGQYGLPEAMLMDNGSPWGDAAAQAYGALTVWLMRLRIYVTHSRPYHPQTVGKDERFHGTLQRELLSGHQWQHAQHLQARLDPWREEYNHRRPHEALEMEVPASRYRPSLRAFPTQLEPVAYPAGMEVRRVQSKGWVHFQGRIVQVSRAFRGQPVGLRPMSRDGCWEVLFCHQIIRRIDLRECPKAE